MELAELQKILKDNSRKTGIRKSHLVKLNIFEEVMAYTAFLSKEYELRERLNVLENNITELPVCGECGKGTHLNKNSPWKGFLKYCSPVCFAKNHGKDGAKAMNMLSKEIGFREKHAASIKTGLIESIGVENAMFIPELAQKMKDTNIDKYGVEWPLSLAATQDKIEATNMLRLGVRRPLQDAEICERANATKIAHWHRIYPGGHPSTDAGIIGKINATVMRKYGVTNFGFVNRNARSIKETEVFDFLVGLGLDCVHTDRSLGIEVDIIIPSLKLGIEFNGVWFHKERPNYKNESQRHKKKTDIALEQGYRLVHIWDDQWRTELDRKVTKQFLTNLVGKNKSKLSARSCTVKEIDSQEYNHFLKYNHLQGGEARSFSYGLFDKNELVAVMGFTKCPTNILSYGNPNTTFELSRFASKGVRGGFAKLLKHFERVHKPQNIYSYADLQTVDPRSNVYSLNGFVDVKRVPPEYKYLFRDRRAHKSQFRRDSFLAKGIDTKGKTEKELVKEVYGDLPKIWDCGKIVYLKKYPK